MDGSSKELYLVGMLAMAGVLSFLLRAAPFLLFGRGKEPPPVVRYLGRVLAPAVIAMLVVYCFVGYVKDGCLSSPLHGGAELAAAVLTVALHIWRRNPLVSIAAGTALYMTLVGGMAQGSDIYLEAERFENRGGWVVDSQFIDQMGSSYLLAHGMGRPVADATTTVDCKEKGSYHVWARTRNWTAPWSEHAAGTFTIRIGGKELPNVLGKGTGDWQWQKAGEVNLEKGKTTVTLHDLTGFEGRCDAVYLSLVDDTLALPVFRPPPPERVTADLVVCGGGIAGTCAAISAARLGLKVALVQDRPMLGGANSSEVRVHLGGYMNLGPYPRLGDVVAEIGPAKGGNAQPAERYEDQRKLDAVAAEKNIRLFLNTRVRRVIKDGDRIALAIGQDVVTGERIEFRAPLFADCTGDGCVGALAGADFRMGREAKSETGEEMAPERADKMTMGSSVQWYTKEDAAPSDFPVLPWMIAFNEQNCEHGTRGDWDWETGMMRDQITEFERIRDYGMLVAYSNWAFLKSKSAKREKYAKRSFAWVAYVAGKRESRRLMGDHVLTQQDVFDFVPYPDGTCCTTWAIDLHYPMPKNVKHYDGEPFRSICTHNKHYAYPIPYRCLYSRNVANLFMAGRNISVTHVALGTVRVMRTTGMMGEVVGMAARVCKDHGCLPRGVYKEHLDDLKALMTKGVGTGKPQPPQDYNRGALIPGVPRPGSSAKILNMSVDADLDGGGEMTCVVNSDVGIATVRARVTGPGGAEVAMVKAKAEFTVNWSAPETRKTELEFKVNNPMFWSDEAPAMYSVHVDLLDATGSILAQRTARFAFKRFEVRRDDGLYLNGQKLRLRGINAPFATWPEDTSARTAACRDAVREVKGLNANMIWSTNAVPAELLDLCDEKGIYVAGREPSVEEGRHPCMLAWKNTDGVKLLQSPAYGTLRWSLQRESQMTFVVPLLPQEGAGGLGAGLSDCWTAICAAPRCIGAVLQAKEGWTVSGLGAHGRAIREIWSPVSCGMKGRTLAFRNRNSFVPLDSFRYVWRALSFSDQGERVLKEETSACPPASPGGSAQAQLPVLPAATQAVRIAIVGANGDEVCAWSFKIPSECTVGWPSNECAPPPGLEEVYFLAGARTNRVKNAKNRVIQSPQFDFFSPPDSSLKVTWGQMANGAYRLDYKLVCRANVELLGFAFAPLKDVISERWVGSGPWGVWGNLREGAAYGLWRCGAEGVGFVSDLDWFEIATKTGTYRFTVVKGPDFFADHAPRGTAVATSCILPAFGPGFFMRIPGIGGELYGANETGPAGCSAWLGFQGRNALEGTILVTWRSK